ncbi:MAG: hypothetical protein ABH886_08665, partial [Candidatus Desantisbacteria bacterium]
MIPLLKWVDAKRAGARPAPTTGCVLPNSPLENGVRSQEKISCTPRATETLGWQGVRSEHTTVCKRRTTKPVKMYRWHDCT